MLPDYTRAKSQLHEIMMEKLQERIRYYLGQFDFKKYKVFEGRAFAVKTEDGKLLESNPKLLSHRGEITREDIRSDDPTRIWAHIDSMAKGLAEAQIKATFEQISETCIETGQAVDVGGQPPTADVIFRTLEKMLIEFDKDGKANKLTMVIPPQLVSRFGEILKELETDPILKKKYDDLMDRKREQWREREASRRLVG